MDTKELRKDESDEDAEARRLAALARRRERAALTEKLHSETVNHPLRDDQRQCPSCGGVAARPLRTGKQTYLYEYVPGYFVRQCHVQEKAACACGAFIATADPAARPIEGGHYGAGFLAHIAVTKCADAIPLHRLAKQYQRLGIPMSRSTLTDLFQFGAFDAGLTLREADRIVLQQLPGCFSSSRPEQDAVAQPVLRVLLVWR